MSYRIKVVGARFSASAKGFAWGVPLALSAACILPTSASADDVAIRAANNATQAAIASAIQDARDQVQSKTLGRSRNGRQAIGFSGDPYAQIYDPFEALGYAKSGMVTKAPPLAAPTAPSYFVSVWGQGSVDREERSITFAGRTTDTRSTSLTGIGGIDVVRIGVFGASDALVLGVLGSDTSTHSDTTGAIRTRAQTPGGAFYMSYINGGFSTDFSFSANFTSVNTAVAGLALPGAESDSYTSTGNVQYRYDISPTWWWEPTVGASYTITHLDLPGFVDGHSLRLQGGARVGTELTYGAVKVTPTLQGLAFGDIDVETPHLAGTAFIGPTDEGSLWGKGIGKVNVQWTDKFSTSVEGEVRGRADVFGYAGRLMARLTF
jgi:hypothetical protein